MGNLCSDGGIVDQRRGEYQPSPENKEKTVVGEAILSRIDHAVDDR